MSQPYTCADGWARLDRMPVPEGGMTQDEIAQVVGCSLQNVQHVERSALRKLRRLAVREGLRDWWEDP